MDLVWLWIIVPALFFVWVSWKLRNRYSRDLPGPHTGQKDRFGPGWGQ